MPLVRDFRNYTFTHQRVDRCGRLIGRQGYSRLYAIENVLRIVLHSNLSVQLGPDWWIRATSQGFRDAIAHDVNRAARRGQHTFPGTHDIYYVYLSDLNNILRAHAHLFVQAVPDVQQWLLRFEEVRIARNLVSHMNFPNAFDRTLIESVFKDLPKLTGQLTAKGVPLLIP